MNSTPRALLLTTVISSLVLASGGSPTVAQDAETLPPLEDNRAPQNLSQMWTGFDPRSEPLETEVLAEWTEDDVRLRVVRFRIGVFRGQTARLAAIYGFPLTAAGESDTLPGLVQIHGGGQYADHKACVSNAKRGYATVSIAWAGRISAPAYRVSPAEVKLFWEDDTQNPRYRVTTDWGPLDGYHAPGRNQGNVFPSAKPAAWTLDTVESPRNSGWFLCALAARRALTFLERQPEVDPARLGVYGHSMGGKLTVLTAVDPRVKAAAPSCGGISDRYNTSDLFRRTLGDDVSLKHIQCPIIFLSPSNDFHGRIGDLPDAVREIRSQQWRVTCSPHHNHQDTPEYEVATQLWFDQHLKGTFRFPQTPVTSLALKAPGGVPVFTVRPDASQTVLGVDVFYTQHGVPGRDPHENNRYRFWHHGQADRSAGTWTARLPMRHTDKPLWVFANVRYPLGEPVSAVGYYYGSFTATEFNLSSVLQMVSPTELTAAGVGVSLNRSLVIENFEGDWEKEWFTYRPHEWARTTHKLYSDVWQAPPAASLAFDVRADKENTMAVVLDDHAAEVPLAGGDDWQPVELQPSDFRNHAGRALRDWRGLRRLKLTHAERLRPGRGESGDSRVVGGNWKGRPPRFKNLRWQVTP